MNKKLIGYILTICFIFLVGASVLFNFSKKESSDKAKSLHIESEYAYLVVLIEQ